MRGRPFRKPASRGPRAARGRRERRAPHGLARIDPEAAADREGPRRGAERLERIALGDVGRQGDARCGAPGDGRSRRARRRRPGKTPRGPGRSSRTRADRGGPGARGPLRPPSPSGRPAGCRSFASRQIPRSGTRSSKFESGSGKDLLGFPEDALALPTGAPVSSAYLRRSLLFLFRRASAARGPDAHDQVAASAAPEPADARAPADAAPTRPPCRARSSELSVPSSVGTGDSPPRTSVGNGSVERQRRRRRPPGRTRRPRRPRGRRRDRPPDRRWGPRRPRPSGAGASPTRRPPGIRIVRSCFPRRRPSPAAGPAGLLDDPAFALAVGHGTRDASEIPARASAGRARAHAGHVFGVVPALGAAARRRTRTRSRREIVIGASTPKAASRNEISMR